MKRFLTRRFLFPAFTGLLLTLIAVLVQVADVPVLSELDRRLEWMAYDLRLRLLTPGEVEPDSRIIIVDIDEESLLQEGRWPWPRATIAALVNQVFSGGAAVMAMDVMYVEPERSDIEAVLEQLDEQSREIILENISQGGMTGGTDSFLAESIQVNNVVLGYAIADITSQAKGMLPSPLQMEAARVNDLVLIEMDSYIANLELFQQRASGGGFFSIMPDDDGVIRSAPLLARRNGQLYGSLALETVRLYLGAEHVLLNTSPIGEYQAIESLSLDGLTNIPTDGAGYALIPYRGQMGSFSYISSADVLNGDIPDGYFTNKIVLFGTTAVGLYDMRSTPVASVFPGVEIHANVIAGLLDGAFPYEPAWALGANVAILVALGVLSIFIVPFIGPLAILLISLLTLALVTALNLWAWSGYGLVLAIVAPLLLIATIGTFDLAYGFLTEARARRQLKNIFGQYVPPDIVDEMNKNPDGNFAVEGESRELSVLFCDIRGFTTISETLAADELKQMLNFFFTPMTRIIFERRGTIDKYVGDMIMAFWGAPVVDHDHRRHAVLGALEMLETLDALQPELQAHHWPPIHIGIGINSGMMNVGDMGSVYRRAYTVIGDAVNLGSRLEGLTKYYGVRLIISEATAKDLDEFTLRCLDRVKVKGKNEPVNIFEPVGETLVLSDEIQAEVASSNAAMGDYYAARWEQARTAFSALQQAHPERRIYGLYLDRIAELQGQGIVTGWDGVFVHTSK